MSNAEWEERFRRLEEGLEALDEIRSGMDAANTGLAAANVLWDKTNRSLERLEVVHVDFDGLKTAVDSGFRELRQDVGEAKDAVASSNESILKSQIEQNTKIAEVRAGIIEAFDRRTTQLINNVIGKFASAWAWATESTYRLGSTTFLIIVLSMWQAGQVGELTGIALRMVGVDTVEQCAELELKDMGPEIGKAYCLGGSWHLVPPPVPTPAPAPRALIAPGSTQIPEPIHAQPSVDVPVGADETAGTP